MIDGLQNSKLEKGNLSVMESSHPLNIPLVSTKIAYEARFLRYFNFLRNSVGKKETTEYRNFKMFEQAPIVDQSLSTGSGLMLQLKN